MQDISIKDKVFMENENIKISNQLEKKLKAYFKKYVGEKIIKNDETLIKKIASDDEFKNIIQEGNYKVNPLKDGYADINIYISARFGHNLKAEIKNCFNGGSYEDKTYYCVYVEHTLYIGNIKDGVLTDLEGRGGAKIWVI